MLFKSARTQQSFLFIKGLFPPLFWQRGGEADVKDRRRNRKARKRRRSNNGRRKPLTFTQDCSRGCYANGFVNNARQLR